MRLSARELPVRKLREFSGFLELLVAIESQLLASYEDALTVAGGS